ncbi:hypothetical protein [Blastococcus goldschmidtiae]|uniref:Uncharacterized protein n=1 Tax=Blastococcus goldschmidtiae TaxID=3075546 RepID=A0ABU2K942_9ACTN|nr:hypothetical protein [Blastococcus sp. DSM 46792]MDT0276697.1 hypothetical protein [Blastococcus sp. DSM 46792]
MSEYVPDLVESRAFVDNKMPMIRELERRWQSQSPVEQSGLILALSDPRAYYVTQALEEFDRELRRTTATAKIGSLPVEQALAESIAAKRRDGGGYYEYVSSGERGSLARPTELRGSLHGVRPDMPNESSLQLVASEPGSSLLLLEAVGALVAVLASEPMTAIANAAAWSGSVRRLRVWFSRSGDALEGVSARQALAVLSEFGADPGRIMGPEDVSVDLDGTGPSIQLPDGTILRASRRISYFRKKADGSTDWFELE